MMEPQEIERLRRHLRAITAKADDPDSFAEIAALEDEFHEILAERARHLTTQGARPYSWQELSRPLGITRQAAHKRYAKLRAV